MSSSDTSSSDSDITDDEIMESNVTRAFEAMKQNLTHKITSNNQKCENRNSNNLNLTSKHKLIYETFKKTDKSKNKNKVPLKKESNSKKESKTEFFIDKGPATTKDDTNTIATEVYIIDKFVGNDDGVNAEKEQDNNVVSKPVNSNDKRNKKEKKPGELSTALHTDLREDDVYINVQPLHKISSKAAKKQRHKEPEIMKKSVITDDFEKQDCIATTHTSVREQKKQRKLEREKTKGSQWYNMPATEMSDERKYDLSILKMRKSLDPKHFYKSNDSKTAPKYFQFGKVVEDATDFYSSRIPKKQRKSTIVEELLADADFRSFNKRKYTEVQDLKRLGKGPYKHMKRLKSHKRK
ncbi:Deoxynucleotidyltransferase terminal-interacting protein 2 [Mactra antiquata]